MNEVSQSPWTEIVKLVNNVDFMPFFMMVVGIVIAGIVITVKLLIRHRERMAMIERGIHPDYPPENEQEVEIQKIEK